MLSEEIKQLHLPDVFSHNNEGNANVPYIWAKRREEIIEQLCNEIYGFSPPPPKSVKADIIQCDENAFAGKAIHKIVDLCFDTPKGEFNFPVNLIIPKKVSNAPLLLNIAFRPEIPDKYYPVEEIIDNGYATASFYYQDIVPDTNDDFATGLAEKYSCNQRLPNQWGKISMWAWAASRVMDYLQTVDQIDKTRIAVIGHSRLGKTALWCAAQDERFAAAISNNSGCSGAALSRGKEGERIKDIIKNFQYWFCHNYQKYIDKENELPFDQHFLLSAIAPRPVYVSSAKEDLWADPKSEFLSCVAASPVYQLLGFKGLITPDQIPKSDTILHEGRIGYHIREGTHYLSRYDWQRFIGYLNQFN